MPTRRTNYAPNAIAHDVPVRTAMRKLSAKTPTGVTTSSHRTTVINACDVAENARDIGKRWSSGSLATATPNTMEQSNSGKMSPRAAAAKMFLGMIDSHHDCAAGWALAAASADNGSVGSDATAPA